MKSPIRNFAVISHIDHGKTTLTDRLLEITGSVASRDLKNRHLDSHPIEKQRGITIKLAPVRMNYNNFVLNLIDTPGHVDFSYEVDRTLAACEGALLLVDATQGIQAQTVANAYKAIDAGLTIIPVINKIDLPSADIPSVTKELEDAFGFKSSEIITISAKTGQNIKSLLKAIINLIPPPQGKPTAPLQALIFNSHFDQHKGVIISVRIVQGTATHLAKLKLMTQNTPFQAKEVGIFTPSLTPQKALAAGAVGYIATGLKTVSECRVGDTFTLKSNPAASPLPSPAPLWRRSAPRASGPTHHRIRSAPRSAARSRTCWRSPAASSRDAGWAIMPAPP